MRVLRQLHAGNDTGPIWTTIIVLTGLAPTILGVTGAVFWVMRRRRASVSGIAGAPAVAE